ncbi:transposase [Streptomyces brasiliscabiei]|uniref:transposase n=1 Tax=Streptomyces brasiliscabiei TaxID=2736302 RepID=UPI001C11F12D|nr:transposase [Streptomyces brasiliscabiei]
MTAIFCQNRTGCQWRHPPHDLPSRSVVVHCFRHPPQRRREVRGHGTPRPGSASNPLTRGGVLDNS